MGTCVAHALSMVGAWIVTPFMLLGPALGMVMLSVLVGALVLLIFRYTANQRGLRQSKDQMQGALLGIVVFQHDTAVMFREEGRLIRGALTYLVNGLKPLAVMIVPVMTIIAALGAFCAHGALSPGARTIVTVHGVRSGAPSPLDASLEPGSGAEVETPPLRMPSRGEVSWRIRATTPGAHSLVIRVGDRAYTKSLIVQGSGRPAALSPVRTQTAFWAALFDSAEPPLPAGPVDQISVAYPSARWRLGPIEMHWLLAFFILTLVVGLLLKGPMQVEL
jgi:hypothetical protein